MKKATVKKTDTKPLYVVFMSNKYDNGGGYYKQASPYRSVTREQADQLNHKDAHKARQMLVSLQYKEAEVEPLYKPKQR